MKKAAIIVLMILVSTMSGLHAQDTIDTNYYRYDNHFTYHILGDSNPFIDGLVTACPNGMGFYLYYIWGFDNQGVVYNTDYDTMPGFFGGGGDGPL